MCIYTVLCHRGVSTGRRRRKIQHHRPIIQGFGLRISGSGQYLKLGFGAERTQGVFDVYYISMNMNILLGMYIFCVHMTHFVNNHIQYMIVIFCYIRMMIRLSLVQWSGCRQSIRQALSLCNLQLTCDSNNIRLHINVI